MQIENSAYMFHLGERDLVSEHLSIMASRNVPNLWVGIQVFAR